MKFTVTMKDPDTLQDAVEEAVDKELRRIAELSADDREAIKGPLIKAARDVAAKWFEYGEYLRVEIDTENHSCTVLEVQR